MSHTFLFLFCFHLLLLLEVAQQKTILLAFTIELLAINALYLIMALRWFFILKLMDLTDMVQTKSLQGFTDEELSCDNRVRRFLGKCFPEWQYVKNLWARRAWQRTVKRNILQRRVLQSISGMFDTKSSRTGLDERYSLGTTSILHDKAESALGLTQWHGHGSEKKTETKVKEITVKKKKKKKRLEGRKVEKKEKEKVIDVPS